jgi:hypothetical protein
LEDIEFNFMKRVEDVKRTSIGSRKSSKYTASRELEIWVDNNDDNMSALSSARSVALSAIERNFLKKFEKAAAEESFLKLYWDMSDA